MNRIMKVFYHEVKEACESKQFHQHLIKRTFEKPQLKDAECPFSNQWGFLCSCIDDSSASQMISQMRLNLIVVSAALVANWLQEAQIHLNPENKPEKWAVRHTYDDVKMNKLAIKLFKSDQKLLKLKPDNVGNSVHLQPTFEQSCTIVITTRESYSGHIKQIMKDTHYSSKLSRSRKAQQPVHIYWKIFWGKVVVNEAHFEVTPTSETIQLFKNKPKTQKWFLTSTSFEWSSAQMTGWIETLKTSGWTEQQKYPLWSEKEAHCAKLSLCTVFSLHQMGKMHDYIIAEKETDWNIKNWHIRLLIDVLETLWLKWSATQSLFFGNPLT